MYKQKSNCLILSYIELFDNLSLIHRDPMVAEVSALLWALILAVCYQFPDCIIEGDAKNCIDAYNGRLDNCPWSTAAICHDVKSLFAGSV
jgi:hypothetical protein